MIHESLKPDKVLPSLMHLIESLNDRKVIESSYLEYNRRIFIVSCALVRMEYKVAIADYDLAVHSAIASACNVRVVDADLRLITPQSESQIIW